MKKVWENVVGKEVWRMCSKEVPKGSSEKHARAVALFVLNSGSRTSYALYFGILDRQKSLTPVDMLGSFLCLCCRFTFFLRVYLWRGCAAELCSHARCYDMLWVLFGSRPSLAGGTLIVLECHRHQGRELSIAHSSNGKDPLFHIFWRNYSLGPRR